MMTSKEDWYAVRCVLDHGEVRTRGGARTYEERVLLVLAKSFEDAIEMAEEEVRDHAKDVGADYIDLAQAFQLFDDPVHGSEVFSLMRDSSLLPEDYISRFFDTGAERQGETNS